MKKFLLCLLLLVFPCGQPAQAAKAVHPALAVMQRYEGILPRLDFFQPHTISLLALHDMEDNPNILEIRNYLQWYFSHLNYPDKHGLTGTVYDYVLHDGRELMTRNYSAVNGCSGVFLHLLHRYAVLTGDRQLLEKHWQKIDDIVYTIVYLQDKADGLTKSLPNLGRKLLADNCEAYMGIRAYNELRRYTGREKSGFHESLEIGLRTMLLELYNTEYRSFNWLLDDGQPHAADWENYYPDAYVQLFPLYSGLLDGRPELAQALWADFVARHGGEMPTRPAEHQIMYNLAKNKMSGQTKPGTVTNGGR